MLRKILIAIASMTLASTGLFVGHVVSQQTPDPPPIGAQRHDPPIRASNDATGLLVQQQDAATTISSTSFVQLTSDTIRIPTAGTYRVVVRFSGESDCDAVSYCTARINVRGVQANPKSGSDFAFDSPGGNQWTSNAMERTSDPITAAANALIAVEVQWAVVGGGTWRLDDWSVSAELWLV